MNEHPFVAQTREYFKSGSVVCPFAAKVADTMLYTGVASPKYPKPIQPSLSEFVRHPTIPALGIILTEQYKDHMQARQATEVLMTTIDDALAIMDGYTKYQREARHDQFTALLPTSSKQNPLLHYGNEGFFSIMMNPLYPESHPRYAPHHVLVMTRIRDVQDVPKPHRDAIRKRAFAAMGGEYDAVEFYIMPKL